MGHVRLLPFYSFENAHLCNKWRVDKILISVDCSKLLKSNEVSEFRWDMTGKMSGRIVSSIRCCLQFDKNFGWFWIIKFDITLLNGQTDDRRIGINIYTKTSFINRLCPKIGTPMRIRYQLFEFLSGLCNKITDLISALKWQHWKCLYQRDIDKTQYSEDNFRNKFTE